MKQPEGIASLLKQASGLLPEGIDYLREGLVNNLQSLVEHKIKDYGFVSREEFESLLTQLESLQEQCTALESTLDELKRSKAEKK